MNIKKAAVSLVATATLVVGLVTPAMAAVSYVGGGTWKHGIINNGRTVYSYFYQPKLTHRASVTNAWGAYRCKTAVRGYWANVALNANPIIGRTDKANWANAACIV